MKKNRYEIMIQELYGYTDNQLLEDARLAELELEEHREYQMSDQEIKERFLRLRERIHTKNISQT